nr:recombination protein NinB [Denitromonas sp.]HQV16313.1 recombination protein NinB [Denitromonas sp.]
TDIARQAKYLGKTRSVDVWRGLFVSGWEIATGKPSEIVPGLEGEFLNVRRSTTQMGVKDLSSLCEYIQAWAANEGVRFSAPEWEGI